MEQSSAVAVLDCCDEEGAVPESEALDLPDDVFLNSYLWLALAVSNDWKNEIVEQAVEMSWAHL